METQAGVGVHFMVLARVVAAVVAAGGAGGVGLLQAAPRDCCQAGRRRRFSVVFFKVIGYFVEAGWKLLIGAGKGFTDESLSEVLVKGGLDLRYLHTVVPLSSTSEKEESNSAIKSQNGRFLWRCALMSRFAFSRACSYSKRISGDRGRSRVKLLVRIRLGRLSASMGTPSSERHR